MSAPFDAWHLPGAAPAAFRTLDVGSLACRYPEPDGRLLDDVVARLLEAGRALADRDTADIIGAIDAVARRFGDDGDPLAGRAEELVADTAGYSAAMARLVVRRMAGDWRAGPLRRLIEAELGGTATLDGFVERPGGGRTRAYGPRLAFHVFAGNVPGVAVTSLIRTLLVRAPSFGKLAAGEPVLPVLFANALAEVDPGLGDALAVTYWPGGAEAPEDRLLQAADVTIVYGGEAAVSSIRRRAPATRRVLIHGPRYSIGLVGREALDGPARDSLARDIALAAATFDQHGCVSPHAVFVEDPDGDRARDLAAAVAAAFRDLEDRLPRGRIATAEAAAIQQERGTAELRGHAGEDVQVFAGPGTLWTVVYDRDPAFRPSCLNRFLRIHPVSRLEECAALLADTGAYLQSVAIAADDRRLPDLAHRLASIGATRITSFQRLPWPPPHAHHDGRGPLAELLRRVDLEE